MSIEEAIEQQNEATRTPTGSKVWHAGSLVYTQGGLVFLFLWLLGGDFSWQLRDRAIAPTMPLLLRKFGGSDFATGVLLGSLPPLLSILISPIISYRSDRHRGRWGRRIPFLLIPTPVAALAMIGLAFTPIAGAWVHHAMGSPKNPSLTACVIGAFAFFWSVFEVAAITCNSVHGALINDVVPRPVLGRFFGLFRVISLGAGIFFTYFLFGKVEQHYVAMFISIGALYAGTFSLMCLMVREGDYPPPPPAKPEPELEQLSGPVRTVVGWIWPAIGAIESYVRDCFTIPYYLWVFASFMLATMAFSPINLFSVYYYQSVGMSADTYGKFSALQFVCSMIQAPIIGWLSDKFHPIRMTIFALGLYAVVTLIAFFFVHDWKTFAAAHVICGTCSGIWLTAAAPLGPAILPRMKFATFASALGVCTAMGSLVTAPVVGWLMDTLNRGKPPIARDYHYIYLWASVFISLSLVVTLVVYRYFQHYGGQKHYVAPE